MRKPHILLVQCIYLQTAFAQNQNSWVSLKTQIFLLRNVIFQNILKWNLKSEIKKALAHFFKLEGAYIKGDVKECIDILEDRDEINENNEKVRIQREKKLQQRILKTIEKYDNSFIVLGLAHILRKPDLLSFLESTGYKIDLVVEGK